MTEREITEAEAMRLLFDGGPRVIRTKLLHDAWCEALSMLSDEACNCEPEVHYFLVENKE